MNLSDLTDKDTLGLLVSGLGGLSRILLNIDKDLPIWKQFVLLFIFAIPLGWSSYAAAIYYQFEIAAFPIGLVISLMALSIGREFAIGGAGALLSFIVRKGK